MPNLSILKQQTCHHAKFQLDFSFYISEYITKNEQSYSDPQMEV